MGLERFYEMIKEANVVAGLPKLPKPPEIKSIASLGKPADMPKLPEIPKVPGLKLDSGLGKSKPFAVPEMKNNSPYNEK